MNLLEEFIKLNKENIHKKQLIKEEINYLDNEAVGNDDHVIGRILNHCNAIVLNNVKIDIYQKLLLEKELSTDVVEIRH